MNRVALPALVVSALAFTTACKDPKPESAPSSSAQQSQPSAGSPVVQRAPGAQSFRPRAAPVPLEPMAPTPAEAPAAPAGNAAAATDAGAPAALSPTAEVEVMGEVHAAGVKAQSLLIYISKQACDLGAKNVETFGTTAIPFGEKQNFFIEVYVPQSSVGHVCVAALDAKRNAVAQASYEKNPITMQGNGEVIFDKLKLELRPVKGPKPLPKGL